MPGFWERVFNASGNRKFAAGHGHTTSIAERSVTPHEQYLFSSEPADPVTAAVIEEEQPLLPADAQADSHYADFYENAPDMFFSIDASTARIIQCNQTLVDALGYSREELVGSLIFAFYHPDCMAKVRQAFRILCETGSVRNIELQVMRKNGRTIDVSLKASSVQNETGHILYSHATWRDISDRKRAEAALRQAQVELERQTKASNQQLLQDNQRLQAEIEMLKHMEQSLLSDNQRLFVSLGLIDKPVIMTDTRGLVHYLNPAAEVLTGWPLNEARSQTIDTVFQCETPTDADLLEPHPVHQCLHLHRFVEIGRQLRFTDRSGNIHPVSGVAAPAENDDGQLLGATLICQKAM
jgi:PAS domain S-box-containing protein